MVRCIQQKVWKLPYSSSTMGPPVYYKKKVEAPKLNMDIVRIFCKLPQLTYVRPLRHLSKSDTLSDALLEQVVIDALSKLVHADIRYLYKNLPSSCTPNKLFVRKPVSVTVVTGS